MNFLAHGHRWLARPYVLAGTAVPDWLAAWEPASRLRGRPVPLPASEEHGPRAEVYRGIRIHHADDSVFHQSEVFLGLVRRAAAFLRAAHPAAAAHRRFKARFLAHVLVEMLLDAHLIQRDPQLIDAYYAALERVEARHVRDAVDAIAPRPTDKLESVIDKFSEHQFLRTYVDDEQVAARLGYVVQRVRLSALPVELPDSVATVRIWVADVGDALVPGAEVAAAALRAG